MASQKSQQWCDITAANLARMGGGGGGGGRFIGFCWATRKEKDHKEDNG
jgi:hypothetical protein